jgi:tetratricopeptide (TPR) repeat protein
VRFRLIYFFMILVIMPSTAVYVDSEWWASGHSIDLYNDGVFHIYSQAYDATAAAAALSAFDKVIEIASSNNSMLLFNPRAISAQDIVATWIGKGIALNHLGKFNEAIKAYDTAIEIARYNCSDLPLDVFQIEGQEVQTEDIIAGALINKGVALDQQGKLDEAIKTYDTAIDIAWNNNKNKTTFGFDIMARAYINRGIALEQQGKYDDAVIAYRKANHPKPDVNGYSGPFSYYENNRYYVMISPNYDHREGTDYDFYQENVPKNKSGSGGWLKEVDVRAWESMPAYIGPFLTASFAIDFLLFDI